MHTHAVALRRCAATFLKRAATAIDVGVPGSACVWWLCLTLAVGGVLGPVDWDADDRSLRDEWFGPGHPFVADRDGDGLRDAWERKNGLAANGVDEDGDGIPDRQELSLGTDAAGADTDGDGLPDAAEAFDQGPGCQTSAWRADTDGDGLLDGDEVPAGLDPCSADSDGDGVADGDETFVECAKVRDCDGDGLEDGAEARIGASPYNAYSFMDLVPDYQVELVIQAGLTVPRGDADHDGLPDAWEGPGGPYNEQGWSTRVGRVDVLVEFVRFEVPYANAYNNVPLANTYSAVADFLGQGGRRHIAIQETVVQPDLETIRRLVYAPAADPFELADLRWTLAHFSRFMGVGNAKTVFLLPGLDPVADYAPAYQLGVAEIGRVFAVVNAMAPLTWTMDWEQGPASGTTSIPGLFESLTAFQHDHGRDFWQEFTQQPMNGSLQGQQDSLVVTWNGPAFGGLGAARHGTPVDVTAIRVDFNETALAQVVVHELGHLFTLCHTHHPECIHGYPEAEFERRDESVMSYNFTGRNLAFLEAEWIRFDAAVTHDGCQAAAEVGRMVGGASTRCPLVRGGARAFNCVHACPPPATPLPARADAPMHSRRAAFDADALAANNEPLPVPLLIGALLSLALAGGVALAFPWTRWRARRRAPPTAAPHGRPVLPRASRPAASRPRLGGPSGGAGIRGPDGRNGKRRPG